MYAFSCCVGLVGFKKIASGLCILAREEDRNLPPAQCGAYPRMPLLGCGLGDRGDAAPPPG